eukprot:CAMPEP_0176084472 /NCGR_PEP_ID=MMETSP0120_2-20121206/42271_1 /TAXON_ID=160619 /ORGANISM="Kryptoperidinium foliaceum, Strain CCMP 1326" /LENGTH=59 /DNA_ID=CAMNT_0017418275 /DNA_START=70 /DNA_END=246 /DNA_ORIENTATION=-
MPGARNNHQSALHIRREGDAGISALVCSVCARAPRTSSAKVDGDLPCGTGEPIFSRKPQ